MMGCTYQYCPPESSRYISSKDSLRFSSFVGLGMKKEETERRDSGPCTRQTGWSWGQGLRRNRRTPFTWGLAFQALCSGEITISTPPHPNPGKHLAPTAASGAVFSTLLFILPMAKQDLGPQEEELRVSKATWFGHRFSHKIKPTEARGLQEKQSKTKRFWA